MGNPVTHSTAEVREILEGACAQRELVILETPYLRFQSAFLQLDAEAVLGARLASALQDDHFFQTQTFLGGFLNLSGFGERALVGNHAALARVVAYRRVGSANAIFSMPMYVGGSLETGNAWQGRGNVAFGDMPVSGSLFFGFSSPLGPLFFGYGRSSAGSDSWYLSFGSLLRQDPR